EVSDPKADQIPLAPSTDTPPPTYRFDDVASGPVDDDFELAPEIVADEEDFDEDFEVEPDQANKVFDEVDHAYKLLQDEKDAEEAGRQAEIEAARREAEERAAQAAKEAADEDEDERDSRRARFNDENDEAHSVATGGEVLLKVALEEEAEVGRRRL